MDEAVGQLFAGHVADAPVPMLLIDLATRRILAVSDALIELTGGVRDDLVGVDAAQYLVGDPGPALPLLVSGQIDGYEITRELRFPDGRQPTVHVWAHALGDDVPARTAAVVLDEVEGGPRQQWGVAAGGTTVLGTVDADWAIDRISADVETLLGYPSSEVVGRPFLGAVHPGDVADLLTGLGHAERSGQTVIARLRIRGSDGGWRWCRAWLAPLGEAAGFAFMVRAAGQDATVSDVAAQLQERLARIAYEVRAASALTSATALPPTHDMPGLAELTAREWQVVTALQRGARGADVARELNLAPSTVRNHLAAVYRKLGVGSQVELLAALQRHQG